MKLLYIPLSVASLALPAAAQQTVCGAEIWPDDIVGNYTLEVGNAIMTGGGKVVPVKAQSTSQVAIYSVNDKLVMGEPPYTVDLEIAGEDEPDWNWNSNPIMVGVSGDDFAFMAGCDVSELPRIVGTGVSNSTEGTAIDFTYRLIVWDLTESGANMLGSLQWSGGGITQKRGVFLSP